MKTAIHPTYNAQVTVTCACGNSFVSGSTNEEINVEICHACHPFYTGKSKVVDTAGRVDRFKKLTAKQETVAQKRKGKKAKRDKQVADRALKEEQEAA